MTASGIDKPRVRSAARAVQILQLVAQADSDGISASAISAQLSLPRQVVYHLAHTLVGMKMLRKVGRGSYLLGLGAAGIATGLRRQLVSGEVMSVYAERAAEATGETAYIVSWLDDEIVVLGTARGRGMIQAVEVPRGTAGDAHARASGKMLLAMVGDAERNAYLKRHPLRRRTASTITTRARLEEELELIRTRRFATECGEYEDGLSCLAVPIGPEPTSLVLGISAPSQRLTMELDSYLATLRHIAADASHGDE